MFLRRPRVCSGSGGLTGVRVQGRKGSFHPPPRAIRECPAPRRRSGRACPLWSAATAPRRATPQLFQPHRLFSATDSRALFVCRLRQRQRPFDFVFKLPYIAGPVVGREIRQRPGRQARRRQREPCGKPGQKVGRQKRNIVFSLPQGGQHDRKNIDAVVKIIPETSSPPVLPLSGPGDRKRIKACPQCVN